MSKGHVAYVLPLQPDLAYSYPLSRIGPFLIIDFLVVSWNGKLTKRAGTIFLSFLILFQQKKIFLHFLKTKTILLGHIYFGAVLS